jgi:hypothetical protein
MSLNVGGKEGRVGVEALGKAEALVEDYRGAKEFLAEKLELLDVGNSDGEVETTVGVVREAREARFFVLWFCVFSISRVDNIVCAVILLNGAGHWKGLVPWYVQVQ